jgi:hypothetical protein
MVEMLGQYCPHDSSLDQSGGPNRLKVTDGERAVMAVKGIEGKRLYHKDPIKKQEK